MVNELILITAYEKHLLARIISDNDVYFNYSDRINPTLFNTAESKEVYSVFKDLIGQNIKPDEAIMMAHLKPEVIDYLFDLLQGIDYNIPIEQLIDQLDEYHKKMQLQLLAAEIASMKDKPSSEIQTLISSRFTEISSTSGSKYLNIKEIITMLKDDLTKLQDGKLTGVTTGFKDLDKQMGGLQNSDLIIIAGETSQGKTSLALNIVANAYLFQRKKAAIISMEMTPVQLAARLVSSMSEVNIYDYKNNWLTQSEREQFDYFMRIVQDSDIYIADPDSRNIDNVIAMIRSACMRRQVDFIVVDYLQLITCGAARGREEEVGKIARALKDIAKEVNKPVVALSQLNRPQQGTTKAPTLARLRDSGQIEEAADVVIFVYRPEEYSVMVFDDGETSVGRAELIMAKGRNYGTTKTKVDFKKNVTKFKDA